MTADADLRPATMPAICLSVIVDCLPAAATMTDLFSHGYALLIGVGRCAYDPWSLPVTVRDMQALSKEQTPFFDTATEDFPVALLRGGKGLSGVGEGTAFAHPLAGVKATGDRSVAIGGNVSGSIIIIGDHHKIG